jgi:RNA polymerase sigma factor for flagellar operon FliA
MLKEILNYYSYQNLSKEEEKESFEKITAEKNREKIIQAYLKLVLKISRPYSFLNEQIYVDLIQEGVLGLIESVDRFKLNCNGSFSKFAGYFIKGKISTFLKKRVFIYYVPESSIYQIFRIFKYLREKESFSIDPKIIGKDLHLSVKTISKLFPYVEYVADRNTFFSNNIKYEVKNIKLDFSERISEKDMDIVEMRHIENRSWRDIGKEINMSHEGSRKKYKTIVKKMKDSL